MIILGFCLAFFVGFIMGLVGAGGSIVSSAIMIYLFHLSPVLATSYSLFTVACISLVGSIRYHQLRLIDVKLGLLFSIPAVILIYFMRRVIMPQIPNQLFSIGSIAITKNLMILLGFAIIMIVVSTTMLRKTGPIPKSSHINYTNILLTGSMVGFLTGFIGIGGGFIIVPSLIFILGLDVKKAIGTSLFIIAINTTVGFIVDILTTVYFDWSFLAIYISITIAGMLTGTLLFGHLNNKWIKKAFAYVVLIIGVWIIIKETILTIKS